MENLLLFSLWGEETTTKKLQGVTLGRRLVYFDKKTADQGQDPKATERPIGRYKELP